MSPHALHHRHTLALRLPPCALHQLPSATKHTLIVPGALLAYMSQGCTVFPNTTRSRTPPLLTPHTIAAPRVCALTPTPAALTLTLNPKNRALEFKKEVPLLVLRGAAALRRLALDSYVTICDLDPLEALTQV